MLRVYCKYRNKETYNDAKVTYFVSGIALFQYF